MRIARLVIVVLAGIPFASSSGHAAQLSEEEALNLLDAAFARPGDATKLTRVFRDVPMDREVAFQLAEKTVSIMPSANGQLNQDEIEALAEELRAILRKYPPIDQVAWIGYHSVAFAFGNLGRLNDAEKTLLTLRSAAKSIPSEALAAPNSRYAWVEPASAQIDQFLPPGVLGLAHANRLLQMVRGDAALEENIQRWIRRSQEQLATNLNAYKDRFEEELRIIREDGSKGIWHCLNSGQMIVMLLEAGRVEDAEELMVDLWNGLENVSYDPNEPSCKLGLAETIVAYWRRLGFDPVSRVKILKSGYDAGPSLVTALADAAAVTPNSAPQLWHALGSYALAEIVDSPRGTFTNPDYRWLGTGRLENGVLNVRASDGADGLPGEFRSADPFTVLHVLMPFYRAPVSLEIVGDMSSSRDLSFLVRRNASLRYTLDTIAQRNPGRFRWTELSGIVSIVAGRVPPGYVNKLELPIDLTFKNKSLIEAFLEWSAAVNRAAGDGGSLKFQIDAVENLVNPEPVYWDNKTISYDATHVLAREAACAILAAAPAEAIYWQTTYQDTSNGRRDDIFTLSVRGDSNCSPQDHVQWQIRLYGTDVFPRSRLESRGFGNIQRDTGSPAAVQW
ncbi:MAG: hypothetical protein AAB353_00625 [Candidatus Hydrogenedentota bacterium]